MSEKENKKKMKIETNLDYLDDLDDFLESDEGKDFLKFIDENQDKKDFKFNLDSTSDKNILFDFHSQDKIRNIIEEKNKPKKYESKSIFDIVEDSNKSEVEKNSRLHERNKNFENLDDALKKLNLENMTIEKFDNEKINELRNRFSLEEAKYLSFLNKEFNILNKKMINCSKKCFLDISKKVSEANLCTKNCKIGIKNAYNFALNKQKEITSDHETCLQDLKSFNFEIDKTNAFINCYGKLQRLFSEAKEDLQKEFSYYL